MPGMPRSGGIAGGPVLVEGAGGAADGALACSLAVASPDALEGTAALPAAAVLLFGSGAVGGRWRGDGRRPFIAEEAVDASREGICGRPPRGEGGRLFPPAPGLGDEDRSCPGLGDEDLSCPGLGDAFRGELFLIEKCLVGRPGGALVSALGARALGAKGVTDSQ